MTARPRRPPVGGADDLTSRELDRRDGGGLVVGSLCTGYGGLDMAVLEVLGGRLGWCADPDRHVQVITTARMPGVPNLGDITRVDWASVEPVDMITAGFPCEDLSAAGKGAGIQEGTRSGLWITVAAAIRALRPRLVFVENVEALRWRRPGLGRVLGELAEAGYDACWRCLRASDVGAPHQRERLFLLAHPTPRGHRAPGAAGGAATAHSTGRGHPPELAAGPPGGAGLSGQPLRCGQHLHPDPGTGPAGGVNGGGSAPGEPVHTTGWSGPRHNTRVDWGAYTPAIRRWETVLGRPAPFPTESTASGRLGVAARFVEWAMGLPPGWVTDLPIPRSAQIRALGRGVVPRQGAVALRALYALARHNLDSPHNLDRARDQRGAA